MAVRARSADETGAVAEAVTDDGESQAPTLEAAAAAYLERQGSKLDRPARAAIARFVSWSGPQRVITDLRAHNMTQYMDAQGQDRLDLAEQLAPVKAFLSFAKKRSWTDSNLGVHLRVKKTQARAPASGPAAPREAVAMTAEGLAAAKQSLEELLAQRPEHRAAIADARADKDYRENAPLDAAREAQAQLDSRIRVLEAQIAHAVVADRSAAADDGKARLWSVVGATNLVSGRAVQYTLVSQNEADAAGGKISIASPVGRALMGTGVGDEVAVAAPAGTVRFRIDSIEG